MDRGTEHMQSACWVVVSVLQHGLVLIHPKGSDGIGGKHGERLEILIEILRVQNEQFSEEKGFILRYTEKEV